MTNEMWYQVSDLIKSYPFHEVRDVHKIEAFISNINGDSLGNTEKIIFLVYLRTTLLRT